MIIKVAGFVLVGSVAALAGIGIADLAGYEIHDGRRFGRHDFERREYVKHFEVRGRHERDHRRRVEVERVVAQAEGEVAAHEAQIAAHEAEVAGHDAASNDEGVLGTYRFDANGDLLNKVEWGATVELELQADDRYRLRVLTKAEGKSEEETSWGTFRVRGDRLILTSAHDNERHSFTIDGDKLQFDASWKAKVALRMIGVEDAFMMKVQQ
jgi:hypothetical protein